MQQLAISFVDDNDFASYGEKAVAKIMRTLDKYTKMYEATSGRDQFDKKSFF